MLYVVGFGPGDYENMTVAAQRTIEKCQIVVGYTVYTNIIAKYYPEKEFASTGMKKERDRVEYALEKAKEGYEVALICSGDSGVYGMAGLALEIGGDYRDIEIVCGVTAAISGGAVLGAPLTHDFAVISLSDLLTPWEKIANRLKFASMGDFTIALYNPSSLKRRDYLKRACEIMLEYKSPDTVCGYVKNIGRDNQSHGILSLLELKNFQGDMFTTVFVGNSETKCINGKIVTPRGYKNV